MPWSTRFFEPIEMQGRPALRTLRDAGRYIAALPPAQQKQEAWQIAARALLLVAERGGDPMLARIAMMRGLAQSQLAKKHGQAGEGLQVSPAFSSER